MGTDGSPEPIGAAGKGAAHYADRLRSRHQTFADAAGLRDFLLREGGGGSAPSTALRETIAPYVSTDLSAARLHRGPAAAGAARALQADAFTIGRDVFFGEGRFDARSERGLGLLAHELTHVGQRSAGAGRIARQAEGDTESPNAREGRPSGSSLHRGEVSSRPSLQFALSTAPKGSEAGSEPSETATEASGPGPSPAPKAADAGAIADRVYDLMRQEVRLARERGMLWRRG